MLPFCFLRKKYTNLTPHLQRMVAIVSSVATIVVVWFFFLPGYLNYRGVIHIAGRRATNEKYWVYSYSLTVSSIAAFLSAVIVYVFWSAQHELQLIMNPASNISDFVTLLVNWYLIHIILLGYMALIIGSIQKRRQTEALSPEPAWIKFAKRNLQEQPLVSIALSDGSVISGTLEHYERERSDPGLYLSNPSVNIANGEHKSRPDKEVYVVGNNISAIWLPKSDETTTDDISFDDLTYMDGEDERE